MDLDSEEAEEDIGYSVEEINVAQSKLKPTECYWMYVDGEVVNDWFCVCEFEGTSGSGLPDDTSWCGPQPATPTQ